MIKKFLQYWKKRTNSEEKSTSCENTSENYEVTRVEAFLKKLESLDKSDPEKYGQNVLSHIAKEKEILQGVIYVFDESEKPASLKFLSGYACNNEFNKEMSFEPGEGLPGQVFSDKKMLNLKDFPEGYIKIKTGLVEASPTSLLFIPLFNSELSLGIIEIASFHKFTTEDEVFFTEISKTIFKDLLNIKQNSILD